MSSTGVWLVGLLTLSQLLFLKTEETETISEHNVQGGKCQREPRGFLSPKTSGDNGFKIKLSGDVDHYIPGEIYTVSLQGYKTQYSVQRFTGFMIVVEPVETENYINEKPKFAGAFQLLGDALVKISDECPNAVVHTSSIPKSEIQVLWAAPPAGTGCVVFKATVIEHRELWYMDDGNLTRQLCEEDTTGSDIIDECCACDEAKYEVTFEGLWSKFSHPKYFPTNEWLTHFSDIVGASHTADFRIWEAGGYASEGVRQVAEWGATKTLESELNAEIDKIRTIIKAKGLWYPNVNGKSFAVFRVDKKKHLMSLVSMLGPSPDWIVGVSALELCLKNCSWMTEKIINLYPWDAGTDSGTSYISPNSPTVPQEKIRRISSSYPDDELSPFYDLSGAPMKPLAKLIITRERVYEKSCDGSETSVLPTDEPEHEDDRPECRVTEWSEWSPCSVTCGEGIRTRTRAYLMEQKAKMMGCITQLVERELCELECTEGFSCETTLWSDWSECSVTCGKGHRMRTRKYVNSMARKTCALSLVNKEMCMADIPECEHKEIIDDNCAVTQWSEWSPCTVTCGKGMKIRTRLYLDPTSMKMCNVELIQKMLCMAERPDCTIHLVEAKEICMQPKEVGPCRGYFARWYYDFSKRKCQLFIYGGCRGNKNNFAHYFGCNQTCAFMPKAPSSTVSTLSTSSIEVTTSNESPAVICKQPMVKGPCKGYMPRWYYDHTKQLCLQFIYGGCQGNRNNFKFLSDCEKMCSGKLTELRSTEPTLVLEVLEDTNKVDSPDVICMLPKDEGPCKDYFSRWYYDHNKQHCMGFKYGGCGGNPNNFQYFTECEQVCEISLAALSSTISTLAASPIQVANRSNNGPVIDCMVTPWSDWSPCSHSCENGRKEKRRMIKVHPQNGGKHCPRRLVRIRKCNNNVPCSVDCMLSPWGEWSACTKTCGDDGVQQRERQIKRPAKHGGIPCGPKVERRYCNLRPCLLQ